MNNQSAKNGFRTFILTLSVSLIVFSLIYYAVSNGNFSDEKSLDLSDKGKETAYVVETEEVAGAFNETDSVFAEIKDNSEGNVLALTDSVGTDTTTTTTTTTQEESTTSAPTPETGIFSVTLGLSLSLVMFILGLVVISKNPRNLALSSFEKKFQDFE